MQSFKLSWPRVNQASEFASMRQIRTKSSIFASHDRFLPDKRPRLAFKRRLRHSCECTRQGQHQQSVDWYDQHARSGNIVNTVFWIACVVSMMTAVSRSSFSLLVIAIQQEFSLQMQDVGALQSSLLLGYMLGQVCSISMMVHTSHIRCLLSILSLHCHVKLTCKHISVADAIWGSGR